MMKLIEIKKARTHTQYKNAAGKRVCGVTTVLNLLAKPALVKWANNLGLQGIDSRKYVDALAEAGTVAHAMVEAEFVGSEADLSEYSPKTVDLATNSVLKFLDWEAKHNISEVQNEMKMVSEQHQYGGTCDIYCILDGKPTLIDLKTGKAVYKDQMLQLAAYRHLLIENGYPVDGARILRIGRDEAEGFEDKEGASMDTYFEIFLRLREIYDLMKDLDWSMYSG